MKNACKVKKDKQELEKKIEDFRKDIIRVFSDEVDNRGCIGGIAEIYDSKKPFEPKGTVSQAWSVAEILRIITD